MSQKTIKFKIELLPLSSVVFTVFLVLKLTGVIDWSWWYVTMPLWIGAAVIFCLWILALVVISLFRFIDWLWCKASPKRAEKRSRQKNIKAVRKALDNYGSALTRRR